MADAAVAPVRIELLGGFRIAVGDKPIPASSWRRRKSADVIKLLALAPGHRLHREQLMDALWPDLAPAPAAANLRKAVHYARRAVDTDDLIVSAGEQLSLPTDGLWIDVDALRAAAARARRAADPALYDEAVELYRDGLLPEDRYEDWVLARRDELHAEYVALLEELASLREARGDLDDAERVATLLVAADPLREEAHVLLMRLHALAGRRSEALRQFERLRGLLDEELGLEPGAAAQQLYEEIRAGQTAEPDLTSELWERVGELRVLAGDTFGAVKAFDRSLETAEATSAARLHRQAAMAWLMQQEPEQAEPYLTRAEASSPDDAEQARLVCLRATQAWQRGELGLAQSLGEEARGRATTPDDVAAAQETLAIVSHMRGDWHHGLELELSRLEDEGGEAPVARVFDIHHCIGQYHLYGDGLLDGVEAYARRMLTLAERANAVPAQAFAWCLLGESLLLHAHWDEAVGCLERSCELHASLGTRSGALAWQRLAEAAVCRGALDEADAALRRAAAIATVSPMAKHLWGRIYATTAFEQLQRGDPEAAAGAVRSAAAAAARYGDCPSCSALLNPVAAEALGSLGDPDGAAAHAAAADGVAGMFASSAWRAMAESANGSVAAARGEHEAARARFETASDLYDRAAQPFWRERAREQAAGNVQGTPAS